MAAISILLIISIIQWLSPKLFPARSNGIDAGTIEKYSGHYSAFFNLTVVIDIGVSIIAFMSFKNILGSDTSRPVFQGIPILSFGIIPLLLLCTVPLLISKLWWDGYLHWASQKFSYDYRRVTVMKSVLLSITGLSFIFYGIYFTKSV